MPTPHFMILLTILTICSQAIQCSGQPLGMDDYYNLVEPKNNIDIWAKPRGKVNLKNLILSIQKFESKQKQYWHNKHDEKKITTNDEVVVTSKYPPRIPTQQATITTTTAAATKTDAIAPQLSSSEPYFHPSKLTNLQEQMEGEQKRFYHSALDGWMY